MFKFLHNGTMKSEKSTGRFSLSWDEKIKLVFRFFQFVLGLVVIGLYAQDLNHAHQKHVGADPKWVFATFSGAFGSFMALVMCAPVKVWFFFFLDFLVFFLYLVTFGIFGKMYIHENPEGNAGIQRMKNSVWVVLTNMLLWIITCLWGAVTGFRIRKGRTQFTGLAPSQV